MNSPGWTVRKLNHEDSSDRALLLPLLREYFDGGAGVDADARYQWLYLDNPSGRARTYAALVDDRAVGVTSLFPRTMRVGGSRTTGAIGGDGYVTPSFRKRGIVTALHQMAHRDLDVGLSFMFGPPEPANLRALLRAGAVVTGSVRRYTRALRARGLGLRLPQFVPAGVLDRLLRPQASVLTLETLGRAPDPRVEQVWDATALDASPGEVLPVGDARFYAWRFGLSAGGRQEGMIVLDAGRPVGVAAVERHGERRAIVDVTCTHSSFRKVVQAILASSADADAVDIQIHIPCRMKELALWTLGFVPRGTKAFQVQLRVDDGARTLLTTPAAWKYMWGDGDLGSVYE